MWSVLAEGFWHFVFLYVDGLGFFTCGGFWLRSFGALTCGGFRLWGFGPFGILSFSCVDCFGFFTCVGFWDFLGLLAFWLFYMLMVLAFLFVDSLDY